jgi:two-component system, LytTR family, response regulator LytT
MNNLIDIRHNGVVRSLDTNEILYIKSDNVYVEIHTRENRYIQRKFLTQIMEELPQQFVRIHRSYLVNTDHVTNKKKSYFMIDDIRVPVSRTFNLASGKV